MSLKCFISIKPKQSGVTNYVPLLTSKVFKGLLEREGISNLRRIISDISSPENNDSKKEAEEK